MGFVKVVLWANCEGACYTGAQIRFPIEEKPMRCKVIKTGNSMVVALPKEMLDALQIADGQEVFAEPDLERRHIVVAPNAVVVDGVNAEFARQVADSIDAYRPALEALAQ